MATKHLIIGIVSTWFLATAASADDELLKLIFNGPGPSAQASQSAAPSQRLRQPLAAALSEEEEWLDEPLPDSPEADYAVVEHPADFDPHRYDDVPADQYEQLYADPEFQNWYLTGIGNPPVPDGMTAEQFVAFTESGCDGQAPCGTYLGVPAK